MSIYEEAGDVYFKGHRNQVASLPFYRVLVITCYFPVITLLFCQNFPFGQRQTVVYICVLTFVPRCALPGWQSAVCKEHQGHPFRVQILEQIDRAFDEPRRKGGGSAVCNPGCSDRWKDRYTSERGLQESPCYLPAVTVNTEVNACVLFCFVFIFHRGAG